MHPRPDERHIRYADVYELRPAVSTEFNIEGYPSEKFLDLILKVKPTQVTLVPDAHDVITSNSGWDTKTNFDFLSKIIDRCKAANIRTSIFVEPNLEMVDYAARPVPTASSSTPSPMPCAMHKTARQPLPPSYRRPSMPAAWDWA